MTYVELNRQGGSTTDQRMRKKRKDGISANDAAFEARPDMLTLDHALREIVQVSKEEIERREEVWQKERSEQKRKD